MIYFKQFIDHMGPGGFGGALTVGFCFMLIAMMGTHGHTESAVIILMIGLTSLAFGFCFAGTFFVMMRSLGFFIRSLLRRDG